MMVLCFGINIKQGSKYWHSLAGQTLRTIKGRKPSPVPLGVPAVRWEAIFVAYLIWVKVRVCVLFPTCVCLCKAGSLDWDRQRWHTQTKLCCTKERHNNRGWRSFWSRCLFHQHPSPPPTSATSLCLSSLVPSPELWYGNLSTERAWGQLTVSKDVFAQRRSISHQMLPQRAWKTNLFTGKITTNNLVLSANHTLQPRSPNPQLLSRSY